MNTANIKNFFGMDLVVVPIFKAKTKAPQFKNWIDVKKYDDIPEFALKSFEAIGLLAEASGVCIIDVDVKNDPTGKIGSSFLHALKMSMDGFDDLLVQGLECFGRIKGIVIVKLIELFAEVIGQ